MRKNISANDCKLMFNDRFNCLTMKEIGIELKHFSVGTAPETPSFLVNQDELKNKIIEKFCTFFDTNKSQGLEIVFLKSNYGNGKSHFLRTIYTFLNGYENVITREVSLKQEEMDLKKKILESVSQKVIKECASFLIDSVEKGALSGEEVAILMALEEKYTLNANLAKLLYVAAGNGDITLQVKAIAILKKNYLPEYLKDFGYSEQELNDDFYCDVIRMISVYLRKINYYLVIVFDEYEHVFSWENEKCRKNMYENIKYFTDNIDTFDNLFFIFAESISADNKSESSDDPAFKSRKANLTYQIEDISSKKEIERLFNMILKRYEKYYEVSFKGYIDDILKMVYDDETIKEKTSYRGYTQVIMNDLEKFRDKLSMLKREKTTKEDDDSNVKLKSSNMPDIGKEIMDKWKKATSISKKTMLCELLEKMIDISKGGIISKSKKRGEYVVRVQNLLKRYYIISTDCPSKKDLKKRLGNLNDVVSYETEEIYILYPVFEELTTIEENVKTIFYNDITVENVFKLVYGNEILEEGDMDAYLSMLDVRRNNAKD